MLVIGLTGGIGCGKSTFCAAFSQLGVPVIDTDLLAHQVYQQGSAALATIANHFGNDALNAEGNLNRDWMRQRIFNDPLAKRDLERIVHPLVLQAAQQQLHALHHQPYCLLVVPLLFETTLFQALIHYSLAVDCDTATQIQRVAARNHWPQAEIERIIAQQLPRAERNRRADFVVDNQGASDEITHKVCQLHDMFLEKVKLLKQ